MEYMKYIKDDISLELARVLDDRLRKMLILIFEFNSEIISEVNFDFPSVILTTKELRDSLTEKIGLYREMYNNIKIDDSFNLETDKNLVKKFNEELDSLISVSNNFIYGIENRNSDILKDNIIEFEKLCKDYDEEIIKNKVYNK